MLRAGSERIGRCAVESMKTSGPMGIRKHAGTYFVQRPALSGSMVAIRARMSSVFMGLNARQWHCNCTERAERSVSRFGAQGADRDKVGKS